MQAKPTSSSKPTAARGRARPHDVAERFIPPPAGVCWIGEVGDVGKPVTLRLAFDSRVGRWFRSALVHFFKMGLDFDIVKMHIDVCIDSEGAYDSLGEPREGKAWW